MDAVRTAPVASRQGGPGAAIGVLLGDPGQKQEGLDVIGLDGAGQAEGIQSKKYLKFTKADLDAAVKKFDEGTLPFPVPRLVFGVACSGHEAKVAKRLLEINKNRDDLEVEIWDNERLSEMLRDRPDIVREFLPRRLPASASPTSSSRLSSQRPTQSAWPAQSSQGPRRRQAPRSTSQPRTRRGLRIPRRRSGWC